VRVRVHCSLAVVCLAAAAAAVQPPPGYVVWGTETYTLQPGEALQLRVDFEQIPVRRWLLLVEGDVRLSHLNLRRVADGRLVYDQRDESRHQVEIPWGVGESLSAVLTAGSGGAFAISLWGPPRDHYLRAYGYEVNRALEALAAGQRGLAQVHLAAAQLADSTDAVARALLQSIAAGGALSSDAPPAVAFAPDPADSARVGSARRHAAALRREGRLYAAIDTLHACVERQPGREILASVYGDLAALYLDLGNRAQAAAAFEAAAALGLPDTALIELRRLLEP